MNINPSTLLFVPGNQEKMLDKSKTFDTKWLIPDLEDSVAFDDKEKARKIVSKYLPLLKSSGKYLVPRINSFSTGLTEADLEKIVTTDIVGISIGKIRNPEELQTLDRLILKIEREKKIKENSIFLLPWIENAEAINNLNNILMSSERIKWIAFGAEDFTADMGISKQIEDNPSDQSHLIFARSMIALTARSHNIHSLDTPFTAFRDDEGLKKESKHAKSLGFKGKLSIHPNQAKIIEDIFMPSDKEIEEALTIMKAANDAKSKGRGSTSLNGEMIDMPVILRAQNTLDSAEVDYEKY